jgi:gliding motility-associated-like protein
LSVTSSLNNTINKTICKGEFYNGYDRPGIYDDTLKTSSGCDSVITLNLSVLDKPKVDFGETKDLCIGDSLILFPGVFQNYLWQDSSKQNSYIVSHEGHYSVRVTNVCGSTTAEIFIKERICQIFFPNAFTPNGDGKNDAFKILNTNNLKDYQLSIYNRFGQKVFETFDFSTGWNGTYKDKPAETGAYVWYCQFRQHDIQKNLKGVVVLLK